MSTVNATWTGYVGFDSTGAIHVPGCVEEVDADVAASNPHFAVAGSLPTPLTSAPESVLAPDTVAQGA